jgi:hypothetical protein
MPVGGHRLGAAHPVIEKNSRPDVEPFPNPVLKRQQERHRVHEVRRDPVEQQSALFQRLAHEREVALLEVPQAAVNELARPRRRTSCPVVRLDKGDGETARDRVECRAGADDATPDDEQVELALAHFAEDGLAVLGSEFG